MPNVIVTAHQAGASQTVAYARRLTELLRQNVRRLQAGDTLLNQLSALELSGKA
jgi:phosphoglycerate dehydrogenase-like enzyme